MSNDFYRLKVMLQALLVTFLWSTSFVIIKLGLKELPPLTFAGLRYFIASLCLLPFLFKTKIKNEIKSLELKSGLRLILLGILFYAFTQGAQFVGLSLLPAVTVSLMLNFTPLIVVFAALIFLSETPSGIQWSGILIFLAGVLVYFYPLKLSAEKIDGILVMLLGVAANAFSAVLGRSINRERKLSPVTVTVISMGTGSVILLISGIIAEGIPHINFAGILYLFWLAVVNTAFAFTLWNKTLITLTALESSIINGTMLIQIALLAFFFLGEDISFTEGIGMITAAGGALFVQLKFKGRKIVPAANND